MYCPSCGKALSQKLKYCNHCGAKLNAAIESSEKRLDEYLDGLFWITVFGLGLILGGMALMKSLNLGQWLVIAYLIISSLAFIINFGLSLVEVARLMRIRKEERGAGQTGQLDTSELIEEKQHISLEAAPSVTENTTRRLEPVSKERAVR